MRRAALQIGLSLGGERERARRAQQEAARRAATSMRSIVRLTADGREAQGSGRRPKSCPAATAAAKTANRIARDRRYGTIFASIRR